ncbi:hypothetical protein CKK33_16905 [Mucilaginibacter sp. MD40]|uniref:hypothetical protein n=1 Tax=Mucilaginibacter sp. MD40 TaxID=2029590 RepID=UPI000BACB537|nr:hypothetical protein [Mucilaginibacter sp. MD40]PAW95082.1 hypothetical protein CKK33_16905 [Mucilaginibacter sp. MD40]
MANHCWNTVTFNGPESSLLQMRACFSKLADLGYGLPDFVGKECGVFFDLSQNDDTITYHTRYDPNLNAVAQVAEHFGLDYVHNFQELNMAVMGEATRINGEYGITRLIPNDLDLTTYDPACDHIAYNGQFYDTVYDLFPVLLSDKKVLAASQAVKERIAGKLPHIDIAGTDFTIDLENKRLVETGSDNFLEIGPEALKKNGNGICFIYDRDSRKLINGSNAIQTLPSVACVIELPYEGDLDPVAFARASELYDTDFLLVYPYREHQVCGITAISEILAKTTVRKQGL